ncbi:MAG: hypothetical protein GZ093_11080 [Rhodoferax sp.]|uniref:hypothetical protein n=1 Tax=Rhodoferax sp. TaxID=50421 RepID=UPI001400F731|nr:hypothetical protein [Rhodoferax sp.]NDP39276.1 hypothetical protein [Rhodoferax sp.]
MTNAILTLATQNEDFGFWGTMQENAEAPWSLAMPAIGQSTQCDPEQVRAFLDSRHGRHFADDVNNALFLGSNLQDAIDQAIQRWMTWSISSQTSKQYGIPKGLPYLTGFVVQAAIDEELTA